MLKRQKKMMHQTFIKGKNCLYLYLEKVYYITFSHFCVIYGKLCFIIRMLVLLFYCMAIKQSIQPWAENVYLILCYSNRQIPPAWLLVALSVVVVITLGSSEAVD